jgi:hypothetical protein
MRWSCSHSMSMHDDIPGLPGGSESDSETQNQDYNKLPGGSGRRVIGPESETRGGPEAPDDEPEPDDIGRKTCGATVSSPVVTVPGGRAALPPGSLPKPYLGPQGDENRQPPPGAPAPVTKAPTVDEPHRGS